MTAVRILRIAAQVEAGSLALLLVNLFTVHTKVISSLGGPVHGTAYLIIILATWRTTTVPAVRWRAWIPGIGGLLALRRLAARG